MYRPDAQNQTTRSIDDVLSLRMVGESHFRVEEHESNNVSKAFGGHAMGCALRAAAATVSSDRDPTCFQVVFAQGVLLDRPADYIVTRVQEGRRFSTRHVQVIQGDRVCLAAICSFQVPGVGPEHQLPCPAVPRPDSLPSVQMGTIDPPDHIRRVGFSLANEYAVDLRPVDLSAAAISAIQPDRTFPYWVRAKLLLSDRTADHAAALAYISDVWTAFTAIAPHPPADPALQRLPVSLNHTIWFHCPLRADQWLLAVEQGPRTTRGRGIGMSHLYDGSGTMVASVAQEIIILDEPVTA